MIYVMLFYKVLIIWNINFNIYIYIMNTYKIKVINFYSEGNISCKADEIQWAPSVCDGKRLG